ncbi:MAG: hypothetical protein WBX01_06035 [Nitrososphaeraceae archaeon]
MLTSAQTNQMENQMKKGENTLNFARYFANRDMQIEEYRIERVCRNKYNHIVNRLTRDNLIFARYSHGLYLKKEYEHKSPYNELKTRGPKLVALMKHLLLKRMESSLLVGGMNRHVQKRSRSSEIGLKRNVCYALILKV